MNESHKSGNFIGALNSTFLALIPKGGNQKSLNDVQPILLCNLVYKIISKVIASRIKPFMLRWIFVEQFGFLENRQILDAIGVAQETLHYIKSKKMSSIILKLDLVKAYDRVNWDFFASGSFTGGFKFAIDELDHGLCLID